MESYICVTTATFIWHFFHHGTWLWYLKVYKEIIYMYVIHLYIYIQINWFMIMSNVQELMLLNCVVLEKTLESPLDCKEIQSVHSEGDQPWDYFGKNDAKAETPVLWPPDAKSWLIGKDSDAGRDWGQEDKGTTQDEMAGWHHWLDGCESEWTLGVGDGQRGLVCWDSWGHKESDTTERLNWTELSVSTYETLKYVLDEEKNEWNPKNKYHPRKPLAK